MLLRRRPVLCNYYLTYRCNAKCGFCDIWEKPSPYATLENVEQNLKDLKKLGVRVIDFTGGEPLLHQQLSDFCRMAKSMGFITTVTSNGLLYPKNADKLKGLIDMLHFSLDSPIEEEHNASRGVKCFDKLLESIAITKELGERPDIIFTVNAGNIHQIAQVYKEITLPNKLMLLLNPIFSYNEVGSELSNENLDTLLLWGKRPWVYLNKGFVTLRKNGGNQIAAPMCKAATSTIVISPDNKLVMPCYHLGLEELPIEGQLYNLRHSEKVKEHIKMEGRYDGCQGCTVNCYMQPSMAVNLNRYWFDALPSTLKYNRAKGTWKQLVPGFG